MLEREVKLHVPDDFVLPSLDGVGGLRADPPTHRVQESTYWDTADARLLANGVGLRWRSDSDWTCKSAASGGSRSLLSREERTVAGPPETPPAELVRPLGQLLAGVSLTPTVRISTARTAVELRSRGGTPQVELVDDVVHVLDGPLAGSHWRELELELRTPLSAAGTPAVDDEAPLTELIARLRQAGAGPVVAVAKHLRALGVEDEVAAGSLAAYQLAGRIAARLTSAATRAAGGVVMRQAPAGEADEVLVVHRPAYDDWCLAKGKQDAGEPLRATALREMAEETGLLCELGPFLGCSAHPLPGGGTKVVWWWRMRPVSVAIAPSSETDEVSWLSLAQARRRLTHAGEREVLERAVLSGEPAQRLTT